MAGVAENDGLGTVLRAGRRLDAEMRARPFPRLRPAAQTVGR